MMAETPSFWSQRRVAVSATLTPPLAPNRGPTGRPRAAASAAAVVESRATWASHTGDSVNAGAPAPPRPPRPAPAGCAEAITASVESERREAVATNAFTGRFKGGVSITNAFLSLPGY